MLTVLHVDTERGWRGGERQVLWLATGMRERGHRAVVMARSGDELAQRAQAMNVEVIGAAPRGELDLFAARDLRRAIAQQRAQIVHAHTAHAAAIAALATFGTRTKVVIARRVDFPLRRNLGTRLKYARAHAVIAVSKAVAAIVAEAGVPRDRIHVVPDGVDLGRRVQPASTEVLKSLGVVPDEPLIVQVAALVAHKDPLTFVRAISIVRERVAGVQALMIGEGPLRAAAQAEVSRLDLDRTLFLTGFRRDADELLAAAHLATLSSVEEGLGSVLLDAMAFGVPIAATRAGGIPETVAHGETGLLSPPGEPAALAENIIRLLSDPDYAASLAARGRMRVEEFSVARMVERTLDVYQMLG
ncbi:MAG TPA: glycosyltransferase family 4 protein [Gemmatimonadaceae bacterium]|nr:glycosyltransferase family 4 protein [Gemmatimonadaceae bacterium]